MNGLFNIMCILKPSYLPFIGKQGIKDKEIDE
jgi:hypothetical protein